MWNQTPPHSPGRKCGLGAVLIVLLGALCPGPISAQPVSSQSAPGSDAYGGLIIADRNRTRVLREAQKLIADGKYTDALVYLQRLLELDQDFLLRPKADEAGGAFVSLRSQVHRIIENLPPEGREVYLRNNSPVADVLLKQALQKNDADKLAEVARLYYHTPAGSEAAYRIGLQHFDHGEPMTAALIFQRLQKSEAAAKRWEPMLSLRIALSWLRAGMPNEAASVFESLKKSHREGRVVLAGQPRPLLGESGQPAGWLSDLIQNRAASQIAQHSDWQIPRGTPARNAVAPVPQPEPSELWQTNTVFYHPVFEDPALDRELQEAVPAQKTKRGHGSRPLLPSRSPLVVRGWVVSRTLAHLQSHDLDTGVFFTEYFSCDKALDRFTGADEDPRLPAAEILLGQWLDYRLWEDRTNGQISSDGRRLFSVEDTGFWRVLPKHENRDPLPVTHASVLTAFDLTTSEMLWEIGGVPFNPEDDFDPRPLEGRFFLGPPLPMAGQLYCLVDYKKEIQLNVLNAATGELEWSQPLASSPPRSITQDRARRTSGVSVAYADGILVCPTDAGAVVALDLTTRSLLWGFPTQESGARFQPNQRGLRVQRAKRASAPATLPNGWIDTTPTISDGQVVLTPLKSSRISLLDLQTGKRIWDHPRGQGLYVAGVLDGKVIVVGEKNVVAWRTDNDKSAWDRWLSLSEKPTGRGVIVGSKLLLPASSELLVVDLKTGKERKPIPAPLKVRELGNLVVSQGRLISQTVDTLSVFPFPKLEE